MNVQCLCTCFLYLFDFITEFILTYSSRERSSECVEIIHIPVFFRAKLFIRNLSQLYIISKKKNQRKRRSTFSAKRKTRVSPWEMVTISIIKRKYAISDTPHISPLRIWRDRRDTTYLITDKVSSEVLTRYCSTEMAFVSDATARLSTIVNMADLTRGVRNSAKISYYPKIVSEL